MTEKRRNETMDMMSLQNGENCRILCASNNWERPKSVFGTTVVCALLCALLAIGYSRSAEAVVSGACSSCHTMHYSQGGDTLLAWGQTGPYQALLTHDCVGCHTGTNAAGADTPFVFTTSGVEYGVTGTESNANTLAGGNFYWTTTSDAAGHNVYGICAKDANNNMYPPPGFDDGRSAADTSVPAGGSWGSEQITCAGKFGCHGSHSTESQMTAIRGGHHQGAGGEISSPGSTPAGGYRMLVGIAGYEDPEWEFTPTVDKHNQYKGVDGAGGTNNSTISYLCAECHGQYHDPAANISTGASSPWLRHPTDYAMPDSGEYASYGGDGVHAYQLDAPVGSALVSAVKETVSFASDTIVTCVSCHRAHGSPYYKIMRWDYAGSVTGGSCAKCHTTKD